MSDNPPDAAPAPAPDADPAADPALTPPVPETPPAAPTEPAEPIPPEVAKPIEAPKWVKPAMDRLTREKHEARRELEQIRREAEFYKALAEGKTPPGDQPTQPPQAPTTSVEERARQLVAEQQAEARRLALISAGTKEFTTEAWDAKTTVLRDLGATDNPAFMRAIVAVPEGHKVVAALADDPDRVVSLMRMDPVEMAAEMGRMSAELAAPKPAKPTSAAPAPIAPPAGRTNPTPDIYDTRSMSMKEYAAFRAKTAPKHLGGQGKRA